MNYGYHLKILGESSGGSQDPDGGYNPGTPGDPKYDDKADVQTNDGLSFKTSDSGLEDTSADLMIFLKDTTKTKDLGVGDTGQYWLLSNPDRKVNVVIEDVDRESNYAIEANTV